MKRGELKIIYDKLSDTEKRAWATEAGYAQFTGMYKYLRNKQDAECYDTIPEALKNVIGQEKLNRLMNENSKSLIGDNLDQSRNTLIKNILNTKDTQKLEQLKKDIISACENQIAWIEVKK